MTALALFDLDGTLLDTPKAIATAMTGAVCQATGKTVPSEDVLRMVGLPLPTIVERLARSVNSPDAIDQIRAAYLERFETVLVPQARSLVFDGVWKSLSALRRSTALTGVITYKNRRSAEKMLDAAGLLTFFDLVVGADDVADPKPSPDGLLLAIANLGAVDADTVFYVGDTAPDMRAAKAAGAHAIGVTYGVGCSSELLAAGASVAVRSFTDACVIGAASTRLTLDLSARCDI